LISLGCYRIRANRSASSSQLLTARITFSFAGIPPGKSVWRSWSRLTAPSEGARVLERLVVRRPLLDPLAARPPELAVLRRPALARAVGL
jgi:hypothetical protein